MMPSSTSPLSLFPADALLTNYLTSPRKSFLHADLLTSADSLAGTTTFVDE